MQALELLAQNDQKPGNKQKRKVSTWKKIYVFFAMTMIIVLFLMIFLESFGLM